MRLELDKILKYLKSKKIDAQLQKETNQICLLLKIAERDIPIFIRIFEGGELLQILAFIPCTIKSTTYNDTARLLHLLNKELDLPGFGMDENSSVVFYRCMIPAKDKEIPDSTFDSFLNAVEVVARTFSPVIAAVAHGAVTFADVLKKAQEGHLQTP